MRISAIPALIVALFASSDSAISADGAFTAFDLFQICENAESWSKGYCAGYFIGARDNNFYLRNATEDLPDICMPDGIDAGTLARQFMIWLPTQPEQYSWPAGVVIAGFFTQVYGCD